MDELRILIARLSWPCPSTRWWSMQLLAGRLCQSTTKSDTESALLQRLGSCKLEAELVEILYIFWMAAKSQGYSVVPDLAKSAVKPSILSDLLMDSLGILVQQDGTNLKLMPDDFETPNDFNGVQGVDIPQVFRTTLSKLERYSCLPFVRQMAFEWVENTAVCPESPYQGDLAHFVHPLGDGFIGSFSARASLRAISAYLRTLAVAKQFWRMPSDLVNEKSLIALPVHPTLAFLKPQRPAWFPEMTEFDGDDDSVNSSLLAMLSRVRETRPDDELIAFNSPIMMSMERCVEVSLVRWSQELGSQVNDVNLAAHLNTYWTRGVKLPSRSENPFDTKTVIVPPTFQQLVDEDSKAWPLAGSLDFDRIGYLQHDLYPLRLFFPTLPGLFEAETKPKDGHLEISVESHPVAELIYWNAGWGTVRPKQFGGNCGTALISNGKKYRKTEGAKEKNLRQFYYWQVRTLHRKTRYEEFEEAIATGVLFV
ncbi:multidrug DMT transporter permease [Vibrio cholerae]|nr:multidrug DMT transporter permease [Vibrio cholerae]GHZ41283.1 hypothetical protein VCSRO173_3046 [Vibrio cholerae]GHZ73685.1 hypothetical protein VCSRO176_0595 [Vibrio cholerae]